MNQGDSSPRTKELNRGNVTSGTGRKWGSSAYHRGQSLLGELSKALLEARLRLEHVQWKDLKYDMESV